MFHLLLPTFRELGMDSVVVGIDFGSSRIKATAFSDTGAAIDQAARDTPMVKEDDRSCFDVLGALKAAIDCLSEIGTRSNRIVGVGISSLGEVGTMLHDRTLQPMAFPPWFDSRGTDSTMRQLSSSELQSLKDSTGNHFTSSASIVKMAVLAKWGKEFHGTFVGIGSALAWLLTGKIWQEAGLALTTGTYDLRKRQYIDGLWDRMGFQNILLPPVESGNSSRPAISALASRLNIESGSPVAIAGHDHPIAMQGAGVTRSQIGDSLGTGEAIASVATDLNDAGRYSTVLNSNEWLSYEFWPGTTEILVVWGKLRPGLAMSYFLKKSPYTRSELESLAPGPGTQVLPSDEVLMSMQAGVVKLSDLGPGNWAAVLDWYAREALTGTKLLTSITGNRAPVVLTGGGVRSKKWIAAKNFTAKQKGIALPIVSPVHKSGTRGAAAMVGAQKGWWLTPEDMPLSNWGNSSIQ